MLTSFWAPLLAGYALFACGSFICLYTLPETAPSSTQASTSHSGEASNHHATESLWSRCSARCKDSVALFYQYISKIFGIKGAMPLLFGFFAATIGDSAAGFELQYVHKRYGWTYANVRDQTPPSSSAAESVLMPCIRQEQSCHYDPLWRWWSCRLSVLCAIEQLRAHEDGRVLTETLPSCAPQPPV